MLLSKMRWSFGEIWPSKWLTQNLERSSPNFHIILHVSWRRASIPKKRVENFLQIPKRWYPTWSIIVHVITCTCITSWNSDIWSIAPIGANETDNAKRKLWIQFWTVLYSHTLIYIVWESFREITMHCDWTNNWEFLFRISCK